MNPISSKTGQPVQELLIRELFISDVTRNIPPVVYFHEQSPEKLADEVSEYIITGGWPDDHPNHRRVPNGIHEQYVRLLQHITEELERKGGPELPNVWISGFYGSGKSSFAKLLGLALDGVALSDGSSLADAWLKRDTSPKASELRDAWKRLRQKVEPIAVVFDIGSVARTDEHIHSVAVRQLQARLAYSAKSAHVAFGELELERAGRFVELDALSLQTFGKPWSSLKNAPMAQDRFSNLMARLYPEIYRSDKDWHMRQGGSATHELSPEEAISAIRDMLRFRQPNGTVFLVVDEVSQYVLANPDRVERLRAFASALGSGLKGKAWLLALGQQKLDEDADESFLIKTKDRFPPKLRVHLAATNIRDVVHKRLLQKRPEAEGLLRTLFEQHRPDLKLYAYGCESVTAEDFIEVYPMLPGQIDLILQLTTALRTRSERAQGDDQAIRGLLQLLGELFRDQKLAERPVGTLVTLDQIYEVQHTALSSDVQSSMARVLSQCSNDASGLMVRAAKAVALLELIQETMPTDAKLVAQCLYDRLDRGNHLSAVTEALEQLRRKNLLGYSEKHGYKLQSSAGEEWERERKDIGVPAEAIHELVKERLTFLLGSPERPRLQQRPFPWAGAFSAGRPQTDATLVDPRDDAAVHVDFRFLSQEERAEATWIKRSGETTLQDRLLWVCGETALTVDEAREVFRSQAMIKKYKPRRESLNPTRKLLLQQEENRCEDLEKRLTDAVSAAWMSGRLYFRGRALMPLEQGASFSLALTSAANRILPDLFPSFIATQLQPAELMQLVEPELSGPSPKFLPQDLGILELDGGRYVPACTGVVPRRIQERIEKDGGLSGTTLLACFGGPPYGYTTNVVKACVAGLLRAGKVRILPEGSTEVTAIRDAGVRDLFDKDRSFRRASFFPAGEDDVGVTHRNRIRRFFKERLGQNLDSEDHLIADAAALQFPVLAQRLRSVQTRLQQLPGSPEGPALFHRLGEAFEQCIRVCRQTKQTMRTLKQHLDTLNDGVQLLQLYDVELTPEAVKAVVEAHRLLTYQGSQLQELGVEATNLTTAANRISSHLASERPWREIHSLDDALSQLRDCYIAERKRLLHLQEQQAEAARVRVKTRDGFSTLTGDQSHKVLRPLAEAVTNTSPGAIAPALIFLRDHFSLKLHAAEEEANSRLDELLSVGAQPSIAPIQLGLRNREVSNEAEVEALVAEIRHRLLAQVRAGVRVRIV